MRYVIFSLILFLSHINLANSQVLHNVNTELFLEDVENSSSFLIGDDNVLMFVFLTSTDGCGQCEDIWNNLSPLINAKMISSHVMLFPTNENQKNVLMFLNQKNPSELWEKQFPSFSNFLSKELLTENSDDWVNAERKLRKNYEFASKYDIKRLPVLFYINSKTKNVELVPVENIKYFLDSLILSESGRQNIHNETEQVLPQNPKKETSSHKNENYEKGLAFLNGANKDLINAAFYIKKGAEEGHPEAQFQLANMFKDGTGINKNTDEYMKWLELSASSDKKEYQYTYAVELEKLKQYEKAFDFFLRSANQGHREAQFKVGVFFDLGQGTYRSFEKAVFWYEKSAQQGYEKSQMNLGLMYYTAQGVPKDDKKAAYWIEKAYQQGNQKAYTFLKKNNFLE